MNEYEFDTSLLRLVQLPLSVLLQTDCRGVAILDGYPNVARYVEAR